MASKQQDNPDYEKHLILLRDACLEKALGVETVASQFYSIAKRVYDETLQEFRHKQIKPEDICNLVLKFLKEEDIYPE